tara:strand:- start:3816 stop:4007 length:192 start_codon:yes stop_codon:yes gene_type:complete
MAITYSEDGSVRKRKGNKKALALNDGPSTPIKLYTDVNEPSGRFLPNFGAGRVGKIRMKKGKV